MTTGDVMHAVVRRWYITLLGLTITALFLIWVRDYPGVYTTQVDVHVIPPEGREYPVGKDDLIALAGLVQREVGGTVDRQDPSSPDATLSGLGVEEGVSVTLPNTGGQWNYLFNYPVLRVQAVSRSEEGATGRRDQTVARIRSTLERVQIEDGSAPESLAKVRLVPAQPQVAYDEGSKSRAMAVALLLGGFLTVVGAVLGDRLMTHGNRLPWRRRFATATNA